ncbi:CD109 antigen [Galendromus occidentalis]|uniref:CD109 antigen n=1 Tax=Galendromus occidentalis TaxID=34638 RepID=A0AAJ7SFX4_9ACAR|nr:CD109 antigen [Galendromus occidentalis]
MFRVQAFLISLSLFSVPCSSQEDPMTLWQRERDNRYSFNSLDESGNVTGPSNDQVKFLVLASNTVRPGQIFRVHVHLIKSPYALVIRSSLSCDGAEVAAALEELDAGMSTVMLLQVPESSKSGRYIFRAQGNTGGALGGTAFWEEREIYFRPQFLTILIQTSQLVYNIEQKIGARIVLLTTELKPYEDPIDVYLLDSRGIIMKRWTSRYPYLGVVSISFTLPEEYEAGWWTIRAQVLNQVEEKRILLERWYTERFDVYVSMPPYALTSDEYFEGDISANFTAVAPTYGNLTVRVILKPFSASTKSRKPIALLDKFIEDYVHDFRGAHHFRYSMRTLESLALPYRLSDCEVEVHASVGERYIDVIVDGFSKARIVNDSISVYILGDKPLTFKPGMEFVFYVQVSYNNHVKLPEDRLRDANVSVTLSATGDYGRREMRYRDHILDSNGVAKIRDMVPEKTDRVIIRAVFTLDDSRTASAEEIMVAFHRPDNRQLQISTSTTDGVAGEYAILHVRSNFNLEYFYYLTISKGTVLQHGKKTVLGLDHTATTFALPLSPEMSPSLRVVVYFVDESKDELISDSISIPVRGINRGSFRIWINKQQDRRGDLVEVVANYTTEAIVCSTSLDTDLIANQGRNDITPTGVVRALHRMETNGTSLVGGVARDPDGGSDELFFYATPNSAVDSNSTFTSAGLVIFTNLYVAQVLDTSCNTTGKLACKTGLHCYLPIERCDGYRQCEDGSDESGCEDILADDEDSFIFHVYRRNRFNNFFDATGSMFGYHDIFMGNLRQIFTKTQVPKAATLYHVNAIAVSKQFGFQVLEAPVLHDSTRPFFMTTEAPGEAVLGEQIGLRVFLFNYQHFEIQAELILHDSDDYRFVHVESFGVVNAYKPRTSRGNHQHVVFIKAWQHIIIHVPVVASRVGEVTFKLTGRTQVANEEAEITINFLPEGVPLQMHLAMMFDMRAISKNLKYFDFNITDTPIIPFDESHRRYTFDSPSARISVIGDVVGASSADIPVALGEFGFATGVQSGEHALFDFGYHLAVLHYLRLTNQMETDTSRKLFEHLNQVLVDQTGYIRDGAFTMFKDRPSVWLTALAAKIYRQAIFPDWEFRLLYIDTALVENSVRFLLRHQDPHAGFFYEDNGALHNRRHRAFMLDDQRQLRNFHNVTLTAHVLITLSKVADVLTGSLLGELVIAQKAAVGYLEEQLPRLRTSSYHLAISTYALKLAGSIQAETGWMLLQTLRRETEGMVYWSSVDIGPATVVYEAQRPFYYANMPAEDDALGVETTSYALMLMMEFGSNEDESQVVRWLNWMRYTDFGFVGTQDTLLAMEALTKYSFRTHVRDITDLKVKVQASANPGKVLELIVNKENLAQRKFVQVKPPVYGQAEIHAEGAGLAIVQMDVTYNVDRDYLLVPPAQDAFDLRVETLFWGRNKSHIEVRTCAKWILTRVSNFSGAAVVEVIVPTGYFHHRPIIDRYVKYGDQPRLKRAFIAPRSAVFMFDTIPAYDWTCFKFRMERWFPVANATRYLKAKVYEYNAPENYKEKIFETMDIWVQNICDVCGSYQCPYCPFFSGCPTNVVIPLYVTVASLLFIMFQETMILRTD